MGPQPQKPAVPNTETNYFIGPDGKVQQRSVQQQVERPPAAPEPEYKYYRMPDGRVVRKRVDQAPRPGGAKPPRPERPRPTIRHRTEPRWTQKRILKHIVVIAVIILLLAWPTTFTQLESLWNTITTGEPSLQPFPDSAEFTIIRETSLTAHAGPISEFEIDISEPFHIPDIHEVVQLTKSPSPTQEYVYKEQNWWKWEGSIPAGGTYKITITYHMKLWSTTWDLDSSKSARVEDVPDEYKKYLGDEWKIEPSNPQVQELAQDIAGDSKNVYNILLKLYKWMDDNLDYETQRDAAPKSCSQTLADRTGDCDDQAILFASLARSLGVPVWLNLGIIYDSIRDYWGGHGWNNVFIPLKNGKHAIATIDIVNNQFLFRDPYHVSDYLDNGNGDDLQDYYTSWSYRYLGPNPQAQSKETYTLDSIKTSGSVVYNAP